MNNYPMSPAILHAARLAHEVNKAYCESTGDHSQPEWEDAPSWQKESAEMGAAAVAAGAITTPGDSHRSWLAQKVADGWTYGEQKDPEKKEHPCMVPFEELPASQQVKDHLFLATVQGVLRMASAMQR